MMIQTAEEVGSQSFYLGFQILASVLTAIIFMLAGLFLAWLIWGHYRGETERIRAQNRDLKAELENKKRLN